MINANAEPSRGDRQQLSSEYSIRVCAWCRGPIRAAARRDAITCSTRCRQARNRFVQGVGVAPAGATGGQPLRLAYADPPYPGLSRKYYAGHPDYAGEVDHVDLIASLSAEYDGWALSTSAAALPMVLPLCPPGVRVAAWHRGERPTRSRGPLNAWEPVLFAGGRLHVASAGEGDTSSRRAIRLADPADASCSTAVDSSRPDPARVDVRRVDSLVYRPGVRTTDPGRVVGTKPAAFIRWVFDLLGALPGDEFVDVFPGSGGVARAWAIYTGTGA